VRGALSVRLRLTALPEGEPALSVRLRLTALPKGEPALSVRLRLTALPEGEPRRCGAALISREAALPLPMGEVAAPVGADGEGRYAER